MILRSTLMRTICASKTMPIARSSRLLQRSEGHNHAKGQPGHLEEGEAKGNVKKTGIISERRTGDDGEPDARVSPPRDTHRAKQTSLLSRKRNTSMHVLTIRTLWLTHMSVADDHELERENKR